MLLAIENAPPGKRAWYGMFPQLGAPIGFFLSGGVFLVLSNWLTNEQFFAFGWRIPFLASAALVFVGLYVRLTITETPVFREALGRREQVKVPMLVVFRDHPKALLVGILASLATFVLFYLMTVFALSWGTSALGYSRGKFLVMQLFGMLFFALAIPIGAVLAERGRRRTLLWVTAAIGVFGLMMAPMFVAGTTGAVSDDGARPDPDGPDLRPARHRALRALSDRGALHGQLADIQLRRHFRRFARALHRHVARQELRACRTSATTSPGRQSLTLIGLLAIRETKDDDL